LITRLKETKDIEHDMTLRAIPYVLFILILLTGRPALPQAASSASPAQGLSDHIEMTPSEVADEQNYDQPLRPQFHYTTLQGHIGDATGLVSYRGEYHLFNIFDEWARKNGAHKRWGHAISTDLIHWTQMPALLDTVIDHAPGSGSGIVDWNNSSGLRTGAERPLLIFYTDYAKGSSILYSNDRGRSWVRYKGNPVLPGFQDIRDPNVFWYSPANEWRMVRYEKKGFVFYRSADLIHWTQLSRIEGFYECPDLFELPIVNAPGQSRWVLIDGNGSYVLGKFDGTQFIPEAAKRQVEFGPALYATQAWKHPPEEGTVYQMAWMKYPPNFDLTWNGEMSFPVRLSLRQFPDGIRLTREPLHQIESLRISQQTWSNLTVDSGEKKMNEIQDELLDLKTEIESEGAEEYGIAVHGQTVHYFPSRHELQVGSVTVPLTLADNKLRLRFLVDRSSVEIFVDEGEVTFSLVDLEQKKQDVAFFAKGGKVKVTKLEANRLESIWLDRRGGAGMGGK
jgi:fructan beta-fructosidase